jgi:cell division protease FtsH
MVMRFGMSERLGPRVFGHDRGQPFLGREFSAESDYSEEIAREIDDEIRRIVEDAHQTARGILSEYRDELDRVSKILLERETIDADQFVKLLDGAAEEDVFTDEEPEPPAEKPDEGEKVQRGTAQEGPRPITPPRPGLAAEMRAKDDE